jgi:hypothetical protein
MSINFQTLHDAIIALITTAGIAVALSLAIIAAGALVQRGKARTLRVAHVIAGPAQQPVQTDDARELVLH